MAGRLFRVVVVVALAVALAPSLSAVAEEYIACWRETTSDPWSGARMPITRCRLAGGEIVDFASDNDVPDRLYPDLGSVAGTACWFYTSRPTVYWVVIVYTNGDADIYARPEPGESVPVGLYSRCQAEPEEIDPVTEVWEYFLSYAHPPPIPELSPEPGFGVTGLDTYLGVAVPERHTAVLSAGGIALQLEIEVDEVIVHWGDGTIQAFPTDGPPLRAEADGPAHHMYERKLPEGQLTVGYSWVVRWRPVGEAWRSLDVPETLTTVSYPVSEIVSVIGA